MAYTFQKLRERFSWDPKRSDRLPRLYDLRHTFATRTLLGWYRKGVDCNNAMPVLSVYLGHIKPSDTYWYLSAIPELMAHAATHFEAYPINSGKCAL